MKIRKKYTKLPKKNQSSRIKRTAAVDKWNDASKEALVDPQIRRKAAWRRETRVIWAVVTSNKRAKKKEKRKENTI